MNGTLERLLPLKEAALAIGVSVREVYRLIARGELPRPVKVGRATRIPESEVAAYIENLKRRRGAGFAA
jgi:excisionase family DNA binding protein